MRQRQANYPRRPGQTVQSQWLRIALGLVSHVFLTQQRRFRARLSIQERDSVSRRGRSGRAATGSSATAAVRAKAAVNAPQSRRFAKFSDIASREAFGVRVSLAPLFGGFNVEGGRPLEHS